MRTQMLLSLACSISILGCIILPAIAQPITTHPLQPTQAVNQEINIPEDTAIIVSFPASVTVDIAQKKDYPFTLPLASAIKDN